MWAALVAITVLAAALRFWGIGYGLPNTLVRPDEERIAGPASAVVRTGSLRPGTLIYPSLLIYTDALVLASWSKVGQWVGRYEDGEDFFARDWPGLHYLLCRIVTACFGVATVPLTFLLGRSVSRSAPVGLLAALGVATNYLHVRDSHFATVDVAMTFFTTLSLFFAVKAAEGEGLWPWIAAGTCAGLAASTKYNAGVVFLALIPAAVPRLAGRPVASALRDLARRFTFAGVAAAAAFAATSPYTLLLFRGTLYWLGVAHRMLYDSTSEPAIFVHLRTTFPVGFGWPLCIAALAGVWRTLWRRHLPGLVLLAFIVPMLASTGSVRMVFPRYLSPLVPPLAILAAESALALARSSRALAMLIALLLAAPGVWRSVQFDRIVGRPDTRLLATAWVESRLPKNARILVCRGYAVPDFQRRTKQVDCGRDDIPLDWGGYMLTASHPFLSFDQAPVRLLETLGGRGHVVAVFDPFRPGATERPFFYPDDAVYLPFSGLAAVERGGPVLTLWDLEHPEAPTPGEN